MTHVTGLIPLALYRIGDLPDAEAKEAALGVLARALNEIPAPLVDEADEGDEGDGEGSEAPEPPSVVASAFDRILEMSRAFPEKAFRVRAFASACESIAASLLSLKVRRGLLDRALTLGLSVADVPERVAAVTTALDARLEVRWGERTEEVLGDLERAAQDIADSEDRARALLRIGGTLARSGETERALRVIEGLPPSGRRAHGLIQIGVILFREGLGDESAALLSRALTELREADPSPDRGPALRAVLSHAVVTGVDLDFHSALHLALDLVDSLDDLSVREAALLGAVEALPETEFDDMALEAALGRISKSIGRIDDVDLRVRLQGRFAVALAALGEIDACVQALRYIVALVGWLRATGAEGPSVSLPLALPILEILGTLAGADDSPETLERFASATLDVLAQVDDGEGVAALLAEMTRFFASPALPYPARLALLDGALGAAHRIERAEARIDVVARVADALDMAGATERGDALFAGLVGGVGSLKARSARLLRAVTLVRLGRTADARAEIAAAASVTGDGPHDIEALAMAMARCGFLSDMLGELLRVDPARQDEARAQLADVLVEATYLDPYLRELGLSSLLSGTTGPVRETIACLLEQVRILEGLGDVEETLARAFAHNAAIEDRRSAGIFDRQLVDALIERIRATPHPG